jgi:hypothetical protein
MVLKYDKRFSITRPSKIYRNRDFWFENKPSGNPGNPAAEMHYVKVHSNFEPGASLEICFDE